MCVKCIVAAMERLGLRWTRKSFWAAVIVQIAMFATATNVTTDTTQVLEESEGYAWSAWGSWGPCSRTCGRGVAVQERECLPRRAAGNGSVAPPVITVRVTRQTRDCLGVAKRYHECNTAPCSRVESDSRAEQCATYDRRPFRGRFYTWVPYVEGDTPCLLNCRPMGQHFYASLGLVADGTPCTKPGFRAICIQGSCQLCADVVDKYLKHGEHVVQALNGDTSNKLYPCRKARDNKLQRNIIT